MRRLDEVRVPTLVLTGDVDEPGGLAAGRHLAASVAGARLVELEGVAHMIHLEEPERFKDRAGFLGEVDAARGAPRVRPDHR